MLSSIPESSQMHSPDPDDPPIPKLKNLIHYTIKNCLCYNYIYNEQGT